MMRNFCSAVFLMASLSPFMASPTLAIKPKQFVVPTATPKPATPTPLPTPTKAAKPVAGTKVARPKTEIPIAKAPILNLYFKVTVKGAGEFQPKDTRGHTTWSVDRTYSGVAHLDVRSATPVIPAIDPKMTTTQMQAAKAQMKLSGPKQIFWSSSQSPTNLYRPVQVKINDTMKTVSQGAGGESGDWKKTTTTTWSCDSAINTYNMATAQFNEKDRTFNLTLPFDLMDEAKRLTTKTTVVSEPAETQDGTTTNRVQVSQLALPSVKGPLRSWTIGHKEPYVVDMVSNVGVIEFGSKDLAPDKEVFSGVPESKAQVKVRIIYKATSW